MGYLTERVWRHADDQELVDAIHHLHVLAKGQSEVGEPLCTYEHELALAEALHELALRLDHLALTEWLRGPEEVTRRPGDSPRP